MFRNPRENAQAIPTPLLPSTGRPPTPPNGISPSMSNTTNTRTTRQSSTKPLTPRAPSKSNTVSQTPSLGRQTSSKSKAQAPTPKAKPKINHGASILSFFKKVDSPIPGAEPDLFIDQGPVSYQQDEREVSQEGSVDLYGAEVDEEHKESRFNESGHSNKRRKLSGDSSHQDGQSTTTTPTIFELEAQGIQVPVSKDKACSPPPPELSAKATNGKKRIGGFVDDSDSEGEHVNAAEVRHALKVDSMAQHVAATFERRNLDHTVSNQPSDAALLTRTNAVDQKDIHENAPVVPDVDYTISAASDTSQYTSAEVDDKVSELESKHFKKPHTSIPFLKKEETSYSDFAGFEDLEDFPDDDDYGDGEEGEEFVQRRWMREQARIEAEENGEDFVDEYDIKEEDTQETTETCPICDAELSGITTNEMSQHVNACLDGNPIPLPAKTVKTIKKEPVPETKLMPRNASARFSRSAIPRAGQSNPYELGDSGDKSSSAFSMLMSSKAEDVAWAAAADAEKASRGKQAYQRTCPFYKIMPTGYICVDAFRYGAVKDCNAYFLSHFHSDHYIGLTSTWCHGPIFCSKVTGNLVKQQLRVDPKWVVQIDFETRIEIPNTKGVLCTMIPANHCPGSSLFLFEKVVGRGDNPKVQRILHCGDFRACPAHVAHPLLMPNIVDSVTKKTKEQKIDQCYLDTTYLNPRYAFPSQEDVIKACADMCVSLSKEKAEEGDAWEVVKRQRAGKGMVKFVDSAAQSNIKSADDDGSIAMSTKPTDKARGRLLVICGTYSIGKERICMGIARALDCKIWAPPGKQRICAALEDPELSSRMTNDPLEAQIHMQMLMEIRAETLQDYLNGFKPHFSRVVGFRPSGWNYRPPNSRLTDSPLVSTILHSDNWRSRYNMAELMPQRGSTREASCFGVPYSEHSSFRELTMFCCALRIEKIIPTVNVGSAPGRAKMKAWCERWIAERRKNGVIKIGDGHGEVKW